MSNIDEDVEVDSVESFFSTRPKIKDILVEGRTFKIASLHSDIEEKIISSDSSYDEMLIIAADNGLALHRNRLTESEDYGQDVDLFWDKYNALSESELSIKRSIGEQVCELSGLDDVLEEALEKEELAKAEAEKKAALNGDDLPDGDPSLGELREASNLVLQPHQ